MSFNEFLTKTIMGNTLNLCLSFASVSVIGGGIEYCREASDEFKWSSSICGAATSVSIYLLGLVAYSSYNCLNMYASGITALCTVVGTYCLNSYAEKDRIKYPTRAMSITQSIITGAAIAASLAYIACDLGQAMLSR